MRAAKLWLRLWTAFCTFRFVACASPTEMARRVVPTQRPVVLGEYEALGCFTAAMNFHFSQANDTLIMTPEECLNRCATRSANGFPFNYGGVRNGTQCDCSFVLPHGAHVLTSGCNIACPGDASELCGGAASEGATQFYQRIDFIEASVVQAHDTWTSLGCFSDSAANRTLRTNLLSRPDLTVDECLDSCKGAGFTLGGVEFGQECYCGNALLANSARLGDQSQCSDVCGGNPTEICGGSNAINLYVDNNQSFTSGPAQIPDSFLLWTFLECAADGLGRSLPHQLALDGTRMSVDICLDNCQVSGFQLCALQNGNECWGGHRNNTPGQPNTPNACNMQCTGNASEFCGGAFQNQAYFFLGADPGPPRLI